MSTIAYPEPYFTLRETLGHNATLFVNGRGWHRLVVSCIEISMVRDSFLQELDHAYSNYHSQIAGSVHCRYTIEAEAVGLMDAKPFPGVSGDAERLAWAVASGDLEAALPLADEVQMMHNGPANYVHREELLGALREVRGQVNLPYPLRERVDELLSRAKG